jgi:hypothetical protein
MKRKTKPANPHAVAMLAIRMLKTELQALERALKTADKDADVLTLPGTTHKHVVLMRHEGTLMMKQMSRRGTPASISFQTECTPVPFEMVVESLAGSIEHAVRRKVGAV